MTDSEFTCPPTEVPEITIDPLTFRNTKTVKKVHENTPRWGNTNNIDALISGSKDEGREYIVGVLGSCIGILGFFVIWLFVLVLFCGLGPKKVGLLSGRQPRKPKPNSLHQAATPTWDKHEDEGSEGQGQPENEKPELTSAPVGDEKPDAAAEPEVVPHDSSTEEEEEGDAQQLRGSLKEQGNEALLKWEKENAVMDRNLKWARIAVLFFGLGIVICVILMIFKGVDGLIDATNETKNGLGKAHDLTTEAQGLIDDYADFQEQVDMLLKQFDEEFAEICPDACQVVSGGTECNLAGLPFAEDVSRILDSTGDYLTEQLGGLYNDLDEFQDIIEDADSAIDKFSFAFYLAAIFGGLTAVVTILIMTEVVLAWRRKPGGGWFQCIIRCCRRGFLLPIFALCVFLGMLFAIIFIWGSVTSADLCYDSPDPQMTSILIKTEDFLGSTIYKFALYYIGGCPANGHPADFITELREIVAAGQEAYDLGLEAAETVAGDFQAVCGDNADPAALEAAASGVGVVICYLGNALYDIEKFFSCDNWRPLYTTVLHDAICYNGTEAFYWIGITEMIIVFFAWMMLTFRVAFKGAYEPRDEELPEEELVEAEPKEGLEDEAPEDKVPEDEAPEDVYSPDDVAEKQDWST